MLTVPKEEIKTFDTSKLPEELAGKVTELLTSFEEGELDKAVELLKEISS